MTNKMHELIIKEHDYVVSMRRYFRMFPEISAQEYETQKKIMAELKAIGLEPRPAAGTGVIAEINGSKPGKTVAIRADIDALPLQDKIEQPYCSRNAGVCHACGHDGHAAMLLAIARVFTAIKNDFSGTIRLVFQPSEERFPGGACGMIAAGAMDGVDAVIGAHLWQPLEVGTMGITYGPMMAAPDQFTITIQGSGGHGSMPHQAVDPLYVGAQIVLALKTITGNNINANELAVLSLGTFKSGEAFNIIPDAAVLEGTVRSFSQAVREKVFACIDQICSGICTASGASYKLDSLYGSPAVINDPYVAKVVAEAGSIVLGKDQVIELSPAMVGEDFSYYQQLVPGSFMFIGIGNKEKGIVYPHHHPKFDMDEQGLAYGVEVMANAAQKLLKN